MSIRVQLLPTSQGDTSQVQPLTSFLLNDHIAIDAGSLGFALSSERIAQIEHLILTHAHLDHVQSLPSAIDSAFTRLKKPLRIYATATTIASVRKHLFNNEVWVDFTNFKIHGTQDNCLQWIEIQPGVPIEFADGCHEVEGLQITPIAVNHSIPTVGLIVQSSSSAIVFTSDTWKTQDIWNAASQLPNVSAVIIECSFPDALAKLAQASGHLTPMLVKEEVAKLNRKVQTYCVHLKPSVRELVAREIKNLGADFQLMEIGKNHTF